MTLCGVPAFKLCSIIDPTRRHPLVQQRALRGQQNCLSESGRSRLNNSQRSFRIVQTYNDVYKREITEGMLLLGEMSSKEQNEAHKGGAKAGSNAPAGLSHDELVSKGQKLSKWAAEASDKMLDMLKEVRTRPGREALALNSATIAGPEELQRGNRDGCWRVQVENRKGH